MINGTYQSVPVSILIVAIALLITTGIRNVLITLFAITSITFTLAETIAVFVLMGWRVNVMESIIMITAVGLSVDFTVHYGVSLLHSDIADPLDERSIPQSNSVDIEMLDKHENGQVDIMRETDCEGPIKNALHQVGVAVFMAAFTTFLAGLSLSPSILMSFSQMGLFLMIIMMTSWANSTLFFLPMCSIASRLIFRPMGCRSTRSTTSTENQASNFGRVSKRQSEDFLLSASACRGGNSGPCVRFSCSKSRFESCKRSRKYDCRWGYIDCTNNRGTHGASREDLTMFWSTCGTRCSIDELKVAVSSAEMPYILEQVVRTAVGTKLNAKLAEHLAQIIVDAINIVHDKDSCDLKMI
ncbi:hypothetical protein ACOME3_006476 [Neoechinorhynchus agilis]